MSEWEPFHFRCEVEGCGRIIDERYETVWNLVEGWEKKRDQGGTNHIACRRPLPRYRCSTCMSKILDGVDPRQETLIL